IGSGLGEATASFVGECEKKLGSARARYALAETSMRTAQLPEITKLEADWRRQADWFSVVAQQAVSDTRAAHSTILNELTGQFHDLAEKVLEEKRRSRISAVLHAVQQVSWGAVTFVGLALAGTAIVMISLPLLGTLAAVSLGVTLA